MLKLKFGIFLSALIFSHFLRAQLSKDKDYNLELINTLSRDVSDITVWKVESTEKIVFLDARAREEYEVSHLSNAIWVGYSDFSIDRVKMLAKDCHIIIYCTVGVRSEILAQKLLSAGFNNVESLVGGIIEWKNNGKKVLDVNNLETELVHTYDDYWSKFLKIGKAIW